MLAAKEVVQLASEPKVTEALAMWFGLQLAWDTWFHRVEIKSDCLDLVKALESSCNESAYFSMVVEDCKHLCELFTFCSFSHVCRVDNKVAHCLAKHPVEVEIFV